ncbi:hypothetical protein [Thioclava pacifica]|uniref:Uncharacterized protein n=1 Tax=Thioclava pacifica DSM 10166 TaxID=1353537 RepID=A0A074J8H3_9RHOB|nr:hypothetical protein [Thioclava pacifica]KEO51903.1 hypothetical protein TP2_10520 [Thioclava pacifica DSM 10166]
MSGWNILFFAFLVAAVLLGALFIQFDAPLVGSAGTPCREAMSSGGDDDTIPFSLVLLLIPALIRLFRNGLWFNWLEWVVLILAATPFFAFLILIPDCATIPANIAARNVPFLLILLTLLCLFATALRLSGPDQCRMRPPRR